LAWQFPWVFLRGHATAKIVHWLTSDNKQWAYVMTIVELLAVGFALSLAG